MTRVVAFALTGGSLVLGIHACGGGDTPTGGTTGSGGATTTTSTNAMGGAGKTITIELVVEDAVSNKALEGVEVCILDLDIPCQKTDAEGKGAMTVPAESALWASLVLDGYAKALIGAVTGEEDLSLTAPLVNVNLTTTVANSASVELDPTKGHLGLAAVGHPKPGSKKYPPMEEVTFALVPTSGSGPHYVNELNLVDKTLDETGPRGGALFFNVEPGNHELVGKHPMLPCKDFAAHPTGKPDTYNVKVLADYVTYATILCGEPSMGTGGAGGDGGGAGMGGAATGGSGQGGAAGGAGGAGGQGVGGAGGK